MKMKPDRADPDMRRPAAIVLSAFAGTTIVSAVVNRQVARQSLTPSG